MNILRRALRGSAASGVAVVGLSIMGTTPLPALARDSTAGGTLEGVWRAASPGEAPRPVTFSFHRAELGEGRISVKLAAGKTYAGQYLRLTGKRPHSRIRFFHTYWISDEFDHYSVGPYGAPLNRRAITIEQFQKRYTGSVLASLIGEDGGSMRCAFRLDHPDEGLAGGATGSCQLNDGGTVDLVRGTDK